jgi:hypothetical protein
MNDGKNARAASIEFILRKHISLTNQSRPAFRSAWLTPTKRLATSGSPAQPGSSSEAAKTEFGGVIERLCIAMAGRTHRMHCSNRVISVPMVRRSCEKCKECVAVPAVLIMRPEARTTGAQSQCEPRINPPPSARSTLWCARLHTRRSPACRARTSDQRLLASGDVDRRRTTASWRDRGPSATPPGRCAYAVRQPKQSGEPPRWRMTPREDRRPLLKPNLHTLTIWPAGMPRTSTGFPEARQTAVVTTHARQRGGHVWRYLFSTI